LSEESREKFIQEGEDVLLFLDNRRTYLVKVRRGEKFHTHKGFVQIDELLGKEYGSKITSSLDVDFFFENYQGEFYLDVWDDTDIQDMGSTNDIYDIPFAPTSGWSTTKDAVAKVGHTYVIWTWSNHYAKIRISQITSERMVFDWAYQIVQGERQLKPAGTSEHRKSLEKNWRR